MRYNQFPAWYNWAIMPNTTGSPETARLISDLHNALPVAYSCTGTGVSANFNLANVLINNFGYSTAIMSDYNLTSVWNDIGAFRPVMLMGISNSIGGHAWVCDGTLYNKVCMFDNYGNFIAALTYNYLHMNWGWNGVSDGWFSYDNLGPYNLNKKMVYNIRHS
jgi:hypothetical protein